MQMFEGPEQVDKQTTDWVASIVVGSAAMVDSA
jgi:hypothetical protein